MARLRLDFALCRLLLLVLPWSCGPRTVHQERPRDCYERRFVPYDWRPLLSDGGTGSDAGVRSDGGSLPDAGGLPDGGATRTCVDTPYGCLALDCGKLCGFSPSAGDANNDCTPTLGMDGRVGVLCSLAICDYGSYGCGY